MVDAASVIDRAPAFVRRFAYRISAGRGLLGRVADAVRYRYSPADIPTLPPVSDREVRVFIGPANSAGQGYSWARAIERSSSRVSALSMRGLAASPFQPQVDVRVPAAVALRSPQWHAALGAFLAEQTHVIWESGTPLLGRRYDSDVAVEIARLADRGVRGALLFHGSDVRPPSAHAAANPWSPFRSRSGPVRSLEETATANASLAATSGVPVFVSTPDLLQWVPGATWLPVVVDVDHWQAAVVPRPRRDVPVVAHAPTQRWLKGTDRIEPTLHRLAAEGLIEYRPVTGISHAEMPAFYADADIVLDQFALGSYGVAACEAMASGRLVISHIDEPTRARVRAETGLEIPILEATIESLEQQLRWAVAEPAAVDDRRAAGLQYVRTIHGGARSAAAMAPFLGLDPRP